MKSTSMNNYKTILYDDSKVTHIVDTFTNRWIENLGNVPSKALRDNWIQNFLAFDEVIERNENNMDAIKIVSPSATGTGKSQNIIHKCIDLANTDTKSLIVVMRTLDADEIAQQIKEGTNHSYVASFHSKQLSEEFDIQKHSQLIDALNTQCLLITHEMFKRAIAGTNERDKLLDDRNLVIIDEEISAITTDSLELRDLENIIQLVGSTSDEGLQSEMTGIKAITSMMKREYRQSAFMESLFKDKKSFIPVSTNGIINAHGNRAIDESKINLEHTINFLMTTKKSPTAMALGTPSKDLDEKILKSYIATCKRYRYIFTQFSYFLNSGGSDKEGVKNISINTASEILPDKSVLIMDATASVNSNYMLYQEYQANLKVLKRINCRNYKNVTLHAAKMTTGKDTITSNSEKYAQLLLNEIYDKTKEQDKVLVIVHKGLEPNIIKLLSNEDKKHVYIDHWGNITGSNTYKECNKIFILGLNHKPDVMIRNLHTLAKGAELAFDLADTTNQEELSRLKTTNLVAEIIQAINRGACRTVIDAEGNCPVTDIYLSMPTMSKESLAIRQGIISEMSNVSVKEWNILSENDRKLIASNSSAEAIILEIHNQLYSANAVSSNTIRENLSLTKDAFGKVLRKKIFQDALKEAGFEIEERTPEADRRGRARKRKQKYFVRL
ncbi:hypothetical protein N9X61_01155 [Sulfurimonas sp.]|nr:hypothetical protein [Sulfurimonas sp.]